MTPERASAAWMQRPNGDHGRLASLFKSAPKPTKNDPNRPKKTDQRPKPTKIGLDHNQMIRSIDLINWLDQMIRSIDQMIKSIDLIKWSWSLIMINNFDHFDQNLVGFGLWSVFFGRFWFARAAATSDSGVERRTAPEFPSGSMFLVGFGSKFFARARRKTCSRK